MRVAPWKKGPRRSRGGGANSGRERGCVHPNLRRADGVRQASEIRPEVVAITEVGFINRQTVKRTSAFLNDTLYLWGMKRIHYDQMARIGQAMASPVRLRALNILAQRPWRVGELAKELGESTAATSAHLKVLRAAGMVVDGGIDAWVMAGKKFETVPQMSVHELNGRMKESDGLAVLDVRQPSEWDHGHLSGAKYMFLPEIPKRLKELDRSKPVATFCGSGYRASIAASLLKRAGFDVSNVPGSFGGWLAAGYEVEVPAKPGKASDTRRG